MEFNKIKIFLLWFFIIFIGYLLSPVADSFETNFWNSILLITAVIPLAVLVTFVQKWIFDMRKSTEGQRQMQNIQIFARRFYDLFSRWAIVILGLIAVYVNITFALELSKLTSKEALGWAVLIFGPLCVIVNSFFYLGAVYFAYRKRVTTPIKLVTYIVTISIVAFVALSITGFIGTNPKDYEKNRLAVVKPIVQTQPITKPTPSSTIYDISNLGIQFSLPVSLSDLTDKIVKLEGDQAVDSVGFSSKRLEEVGCSAESAPLGYLTYDDNKGGVIVGRARSSDLYYISPSGQCQVATVSQDWHILQEALKSLVTDYKGN